MNQIIGNIYIGDANDAASLITSNPNRITSVLNLRSEAEDPQIPGTNQFHASLIDGHVPVTEKEFWAALGFLSGQYHRNETILIHCLAGVNRSVTVCSAFLSLVKLAANMDEALTLIKTRRPGAGPSMLAFDSAKKLVEANHAAK